MNEKKSLLVIIADQLSFRALPIYGNMDVKTPNIDLFFKDASVFDNAYTTCPLCLPARCALWSGHFPHQTEVLGNGRLLGDAQLPASMRSLGEHLNPAGYRCVHIGKTHDAGALRGFEVLPEKERQEIHSEVYAYNHDSYRDIETCERACAYLDDLQDDPFAMILDFNNPHNICNFTGQADALAKDAIENLPPLPANFIVDDMDTRPLPVQYLCCAHKRQQEAAHWEDLHFRQYLAAYYHYIEILDTQLGEVFARLERNGQREHTIVCLSADHGDNMAARKMVTKHCSMYEETTHVPLLFTGPGIPKGRSDELVSHLDYLPSFCQMLGVQISPDLWGKNLQKVMTGGTGHDYIVSQWYSEWGSTIEPTRMIRTHRYKYMHYLEADAEELYDLREDPYEKINRAADPAHASILAQHRSLLDDYLCETSDDYRALKIRVDPRWRSHESGFCNHQGPSAMDAAFNECS